MANAVTASEVRDALEAVPGLTLPATLTDTKIDTIVQRKTSVVLTLRGATALPTAGQERDLIDNAVIDLAVIHIKRLLRPDSPEMMRALVDEERLIKRDLEVVESSSPEAGFRFDVIGGAE